MMRMRAKTWSVKSLESEKSMKNTLARLCCSGGAFPPIRLLKSDEHNKLLQGSDNKFFIMMHTSSRVQMRVMRQKLWEEFPRSGITGMMLRMNESYFILQAAMITDEKVPPENIKYLLDTAFSAELIHPNNLYDLRMSPVGVFAQSRKRSR